MRIRPKILILLLAIALVPLGVVSLLHRRAAERLGNELAGQIRDTLADDAQLQLRQLVSDSGLVLQLDQEIVEQALRIQAREVENCLAFDPPEGRPDVYLARDFDLGMAPPTIMVLSPKHFSAPGGADATPVPVTYSSQVFKLAPGVELEAVADDVARLAKMVPTYQFLTEEHAELFYWNYTSLANGVYSSYPGHGGYPDEFDPRQRDWYRAAAEADEPVWTGPMVDAASRRIMMTAAMRVSRTDGSFAGVTAIDVPLRDLVERVELPPQWAAEAKVVLVRQADDPETGEPFALIIAEQVHPGGTRRWEAPIGLAELESGDRDRLERMLRQMAQGESGVHRMPYEGRPSLWAHAPVPSQGVFVVIIVPYELIVTRAVNAERYVLGLTVEQLQVTGAIVLGVILVVVIIAVAISRRITRPVRELAGAARRLARGDFEARVEIANHDELGEMGRAFNAMLPQLQDNLRMRSSLGLAMQVQRNLLPQSAPKIDGLDVAGSSLFCDETGGDYYDFLTLPKHGPGQLGIAVGDVTGHGISAALLMAATRALLRSHAIHPGDLGQLMADINEHLTADTLVEQFTTLFYAIIDPKQRTIRWSSAGHDPALVYDAAAGTFEELGGAGIPLGIDAGARYAESSRNTLTPGSVIVIGTDGIWETRNGSGDRFGKEALRRIVRDNAHRPAGEIGNAITDALAAFRQAQPQEDDVTFVVAKLV
jgi:sigma-B regulation protein RsbU (phosphoserine phosphatase)